VSYQTRAEVTFGGLFWETGCSQARLSLRSRIIELMSFYFDNWQTTITVITILTRTGVT